jgi:hypothetical protein
MASLVAPMLAGARPARAASGLSSDELERLGRGETVVRTQDLDTGLHSYIGGVTYTVLDATPAEVMSVFDDVRAYERVLPKTKHARLVGMNDGDDYVELRQGNSLIDATYTVRIHRGPAELRFWLDRSKPHGIEDAWGFLRVQPLPEGPGGARTLVTYGVLVDLGSGIVRDLFSEKIRTLALSVPNLVRRYLAERPGRGPKA